MTNPLWTEVCTFTKISKGKLRDTFRVFVNQLGWCKCHQDKTGKDFHFNTVEDLLEKIDKLKAIRFTHATGELPASVVSRL